jgi:rubrerythrin
MRDIEQIPGEESAYECFECGNIVIAESNPETCPECGGAIRNRQTPIE